MGKTFLLGVLYGVGGLSFGLGIRYIGFSLNYAIAIGISAGLGTLFPLIWHPAHGFVWEIADKFSSPPGQVILAGIVTSLFGIALCGWAGALREREAKRQSPPRGEGVQRMSGPEEESVDAASETPPTGDNPYAPPVASGSDTDGLPVESAPSPNSKRYSFRIGVPLAIMAGVLSAVFNFSLLAGEPLEKAAVAHGASELLKMNAIYPFSNGGAWVTNVIWCLVLIGRNRTASQFVRLPGKGSSTLAFYYLMALLSGAFWYFQFFFYGMGHSHMGQQYGFTSWALHMAMLILFSNVYGWLFSEWEGGTTTIPKKVLHAGMLVIVVATLIITYGNYLGEQMTTAH
jgi:L-rhamnose-H+ transport protein